LNPSSHSLPKNECSLLWSVSLPSSQSPFPCGPFVPPPAVLRFFSPGGSPLDGFFFFFVPFAPPLLPSSFLCFSSEKKKPPPPPFAASSCVFFQTSLTPNRRSGLFFPFACVLPHLKGKLPFPADSTFFHPHLFFYGFRLFFSPEVLTSFSFLIAPPPPRVVSSLMETPLPFPF